MNTIEKNSWLTYMAASFTICLCTCGKIGYKYTHGELVGTPKKKGWSLKKPHGMYLIPAGVFTMGNSSYDPTHALDAADRVELFWCGIQTPEKPCTRSKFPTPTIA